MKYWGRHKHWLSPIRLLFLINFLVTCRLPHPVTMYSTIFKTCVTIFSVITCLVSQLLILKTSETSHVGLLTLSWRGFLSYRNHSIDLLWNQWTGFYMIGTSVMNDLKINFATYFGALTENSRKFVRIPSLSRSHWNGISFCGLIQIKCAVQENSNLQSLSLGDTNSKSV